MIFFGDLVCVHIIFPYSKLSTFEQTKRFLERTTYQLKDIHCALHIFHENQHLFETTLYSNTAQKHMNFNVLYTDSSNFDNQTKAHNVINDKDIMTGYIFIDFVSNFVCSILKKNDSLEKYTVEEIISTLRHMNVVYLGGANYIPAFERTDLVDELMEAFGFQIARELLSQKYLNEFSKVGQSKKSTKIK